jgi:hypothetical protein
MDRDDAWPTGSSELLALAKELNDRVTALRERLRVVELENEKFQQIIARLKRMQFGRSSERHAGQFVLDLVADAGTEESKVPMPRPAANDDGGRPIRYAGRCRRICRARSCATSRRDAAASAAVGLCM